MGAYELLAAQTGAMFRYGCQVEYVGMVEAGKDDKVHNLQLCHVAKPEDLSRIHPLEAEVKAGCRIAGVRNSADEGEGKGVHSANQEDRFEEKRSLSSQRMAGATLPASSSPGRPPGRAKLSLMQEFMAGEDSSAKLWRSILYCLKPSREGHLHGSKKGSSRPLLGPIQRSAPSPPPGGRSLLPPMAAKHAGRKTLVLDLDETLVHSSFKPVPRADYVLPVEIEQRVTDVYVLKRPWVDAFLQAASESFEVVVFTASLRKYADPLLDVLDKYGAITHRLFRESCCLFEGNYVKNLAVLGRSLSSTIIIDNSPHSYFFHPENALPISTFIDSPHDRELFQLIPYLRSLAASTDDVRVLLGRLDRFKC